MGRERRAYPVLTRLDRPRTPRPVRLAVIADPHVAEGEGTWKVRHRSRNRLRRAVPVANRADAAVVAGDLTGDGRRSEFEAVDEILADLEVPLMAVPGNHDVPKAFDTHEGLPVPAFASRYGPALPFTVDVGPLTVVGIDTATAGDGGLQSTWGGRVGQRDREWLAEVLPGIETPVVVVHHNAAALPENPGGPWANFSLQDAAAVRDLLVAADVPLVVSAHHHVPAVLGHGATTELIAPAACSFPQAMLLVETGPEGTVVRHAPLADEAGVAEAHRLARGGRPLGRGILRMVERRLLGGAVPGDNPESTHHRVEPTATGGGLFE